MSNDLTGHETPALPSLEALGRVAVIGVGAAGTALARAMAAHGAHIVALAGRSRQRSANARALATLLGPSVRIVSPAEAAGDADLVLLAVPDDAIAQAAREIPWHAGQIVAHLSATQGAGALAAVRAHGAFPAALHPLMTFPRPDLSEPIAALLRRLAGATWALDAEDDAVRGRLETLAVALSGRVVALPDEARVPYHIAAVFAANYVVALLGGSVALWQWFGRDADEALPALLPLLRAAVERIASDGLPAALSGPIARGDTTTIAAHLAWFDAHASENATLERVRAAYLALADLSLPLAEAKGSIAPDHAARLAALLHPNTAADAGEPPREREAAP